jgi:hypothetical protein
MILSALPYQGDRPDMAADLKTGLAPQVPRKSKENLNIFTRLHISLNIKEC